MIPEELTKLSPVTIRGWFWQEVVKLRKSTDLTEHVTWFRTDSAGKTGGTIPSLDKSLEECVRLGKRTRALDGSLRNLIERGYSKIRPIKPLLVELSYEIEKRFPVLLPVIPQNIREQLPASESCVGLLNSMVRFGALNVTSFLDTPPALRLTEIKNRSWAILQDPQHQEAIAKGNAPVTSKCNAGQLKTMAEGVLSAKGGVCTTFAATAVHLLLSDTTLMATAPRIEFVSGPKHCLCLVNRATDKRDIVGARKDTIVSCDEWNDDVVIIDPWAGSMGYHVISSKDTYPSKLKAMIGLRVDKYFENIG